MKTLTYNWILKKELGCVKSNKTCTAVTDYLTLPQFVNIDTRNDNNFCKIMSITNVYRLVVQNNFSSRVQHNIHGRTNLIYLFFEDKIIEC